VREAPGNWRPYRGAEAAPVSVFRTAWGYITGMSPSDKQHTEQDPLAFHAGGGEIGTLMRSFNWSATPLGPIGQWPPSLRTAVSICLNLCFAADQEKQHEQFQSPE
jgi:hypothetical protein